MRIVNLTEFRALPPGIIYSKYQSCNFEGFMMKGETWEHDFTYQDLMGNIDNGSDSDFVKQCTLAEHGESIDLDFDYYGRDGLFKEEQLFAVYEEKDIQALLQCLIESVAYKEDK